MRQNGNHNGSQAGETQAQLDTVAWGLLFIWAGITLLTHGGVAAYLLGLGAIMSGAEATRWWRGLRVDVLWLVCGITSLAAGALELGDFSWWMAPLMLIALGAGVLLSIGLERWRSGP